MDVLLAIVIVSVALTAAAALFVPATTSYSSAADYTVAANLAQKQIELLKTQPVSFWQNALPMTVAWQDSTESMPIRLNAIDYHVTTQVSATSVSNSLVEVTVTVNWSKSGKDQNLQVVAFFANK